jgi:predicted MFS family arabinose efflux permease
LAVSCCKRRKNVYGIDRRLIPLALGAFVVAADGTLVVGLLRPIADSLAVSPAAAGQAVTVFAAVYALCAPLLIRATRRASLRRLLLGSLGLFAVANAATAAFFTYVGVVLHRTASVGTAGLAGFLLLFGLAGLGGAALSGWLTDAKGPLPTLAGALALIAVSLAGLGLAATLGNGRTAVVLSATAMAAYGVGTWAITAPPPSAGRRPESNRRP